MKAYVEGWQVEQHGPAFSTRREEADGSISYEALADVTIRLRVVGNDIGEFIRGVKVGDRILGLQVIENSKLQGQEATTLNVSTQRKYNFE